MFEAYCREKLGPLMLRLALGLVCVYHGFLKIMAVGGTAWSPDLPVLWQVALAWGEFVGGVAVLAGFRCRVAAGIALACTLGHVFWANGWGLFQLPWIRLERIVTVILMELSLVFLGGGDLALDGGKGRGSRGRPMNKIAA